MIYEDDLYETAPLPPLWKIELPVHLSGDQAQAIADALEDLAITVYLHNSQATDGDCWDIHLTVAGQPDEAILKQRLADLQLTCTPMCTPIVQKDWLKAVHEDFPPLTLGPFFVYGSHYTGAIPGNTLTLQIDAATAFGSGEHETTQGCLLALSELAKERHQLTRGLDMGCGSGILAVAMARLWPRMQVTAIDIDPESTIVTARHAELNAVDRRLHIETGDGYAAALVTTHAPFDLIVANILAGPLVSMAPHLVRHLASGGICVLSGLLQRQMADVAAAHTAQGLQLVNEHQRGEWSTLVLRKP